MRTCKWCGANLDPNEPCNCDESRLVRNLPHEKVKEKTAIQPDERYPEFNIGDEIMINFEIPGAYRYPRPGTIGIIKEKWHVGVLAEFPADQCPKSETSFFLPYCNIAKVGRQEQLKFDEVAGG